MWDAGGTLGKWERFSLQPVVSGMMGLSPTGSSKDLLYKASVQCENARGHRIPPRARAGSPILSLWPTPLQLATVK